MKNKILLAVLVAGLLASAACSSSAPANANKTTNTTTTTTTTNTNTSNTSAPATNSNSSTAANTNTTSNSGSAQQGGKQDFTLVNQTGVEIDKVFIGPHSSDDWGEDILGQDTLPTGQSVDIKFSRSEKAAMWDLRIEDKQGNSIEWENLNLLEISKVTLFYKDGKGTAQTE
ncbi:MAG TPA: hypothetical protein VJS44_11250 [Pyrinomonadaceae bacterium]|nr:hypothetical protein [Pyrinomonadaceae bacterium]